MIDADLGIPAVEAHLFGALEKTCLIRPGMPPKEMSYTRCGRTDIGVSALANMITLEVRSKAAAGQPLPPADQELDYPFLLNKVLPPDIQITGWAPADPSFHARFSATNRRYKYFFAGPLSSPPHSPGRPELDALV